MRTFCLLVVALLVGPAFAQDAAKPAPAATSPAAAAPAPAPAPKKLVLITESKGFVHDVVKRKDGQPCLVEKTFQELADKTKLFTVEASQDASILTPEKLKNTDIVVFYTTLNVSVKPDALDEFVKNGGSFLGLHSATDTFHGNPVYLNLVGGEFAEHPWGADKTVSIKVLDPNHPAAKAWEGGATFPEEIYHQKNFDPAKEHVIIGLDMEKTELKKPYFVPIAWCKEYGKGKMFYTSLGHREEMWTNPKYQDHLIAAIKWLEGLAPADATPNPAISAAEDATAKKVAPPEKPAEPEKKADADAPAPAKVPDGFTITTFVKAPDIKSPASITSSPDGKLFVGEDEYNTQPKRDPGLARVKLCIDTDHDGKADKITVFADKLNAPQGITYVGETLYVMHAPFLTAFRDTNGDGVADTRTDLVTGLGPIPEGLVHHIPSGLRMGIDGWLYISIGDKGIEKATGKDGRTVSLWGGGVVRIRPDGTMMEIYSHHTRNTFDVSIDPYLDVFTRDNTNDGDGWDSRLTQMQRDGEYGYPRLFKHFGDEMIDPIAAYGSGSATGSMYVAEPGFPKTYGDSLYTSDWARGILYRHDLKRKGAGFEATQEEFIKDIRPTDLDVDANQQMFVADWGRRDWGNVGAVGSVYLVQPKYTATQPSIAKPYPDMAKASDDELLTYLTGPSAIYRVNAQQELLHRGPSPKMSAALTGLAMKRGELYARIAAMFTLKQLDGDNANGSLATIASLPEMREYALRAMVDRDDELHGINANLFVQSLKDPSPRVRVQAAIGIGHLRKSDLAAALVPVTADTDPLVRHAAMQSLRRLQAESVCIAALSDFTQPDVVMGASRTLREFHTLNSVAAIAQLYATAKTPALRQEAIKSLAQLYHVEKKWDGKWWTPHPDTRGPYYVSEPWSESNHVAQVMITAINDVDPATAKMALTYIGLIQMQETIPTLTRVIAGGGALRDDAAKALIATKASTPEATAALERVVLGDTFDPEVRAQCAAALAAIEPAKSQPILVRIIGKLDGAAKIPPGLLEKVCDALAAGATPADRTSSVIPLLGAAKPPVRAAAATTLMRSPDPAVREQVGRIWTGGDPIRIEALLSAVPKLPADASTPYATQIHALLKDPRDTTRHLATIALGHIGDASAVKDLVQLASRDRDPLPAVSALAGIDPAKTADDQVLVIATLLVENSGKVQKDNADAYARLVSAAQKFISDPRVPAPKASSLRSKLMEPGVISIYMKSDPILVPAGPEATFTTPFPPEQAPGGPFLPFSIGGKEITWKPLTVTDPTGKQPMEAPDSSVIYLTAKFNAAAAGSGWLTCGSDDGLQVWVNGAKIVSKNEDRGLIADKDRSAVTLKAGENALLFKVNNRGGVAGIQSRLRTKVAEFEPEDMVRVAHTVKGTPTRGREMFETIGCVKCHTIDRHEEPKGPFLGDVGGKFDGKYLVESVMRPSAKIAQGFATENITVKGQGDYTGFVTRETADEVQLRDLTGKVTVVAKGNITKRATLPGSMMPTGLVDNLSLDDFASLLNFLESMKKG